MRAVCESFHLAKDAGFKVVAHMMPDLPNVGMERDVEQFIVSIFICSVKGSGYPNTFFGCHLFAFMWFKTLTKHKRCLEK